MNFFFILKKIFFFWKFFWNFFWKFFNVWIILIHKKTLHLNCQNNGSKEWRSVRAQWRISCLARWRRAGLKFWILGSLIDYCLWMPHFLQKCQFSTLFGQNLTVLETWHPDLARIVYFFNKTEYLCWSFALHKESRVQGQN